MTVDIDPVYLKMRLMEPDPKLKKDIEARSIFKVGRAFEHIERGGRSLTLRAKMNTYDEVAIVLCPEWYFKPEVDYEVALARLLANAYEHYAKFLANPEDYEGDEGDDAGA